MSLEILVLKMNGCDIRVPTIVSLSYLTVLELSGITFTCKTFNDSEKLINLPVLRKYEAENCSWLNVKGGVTFEVPLLEVLLIKHTLVSKPHESHTVVKFCAPRLNDFTYSDFVLRYTVLLDLDLSTARIVAANIHLIKLSEDSEENMATFACEVLKQFNNNVERLKLEVSKNMYDYHLSPVRVPALTDLDDFGMLNRLELVREVTGEVLLDFLQKSPFLETLVIFKVVEFDEEFSNPDNVPFCFISNLQVLKLGHFDGNEQELRFIKFVMENALVLKRASFSAVRSLHIAQVKFEEVKKKISSFKRSLEAIF
ncbi:F-box/FBD/LRR-repeat protein At5g44980 [Cajanus cajan]|uniref:F-box/FBD/LRR-repeat protein At5g44980 n=1 Tax=Cajanus cajan TaxID=3821 RepID=UPI00098D93E8|nr:F-box/FBD/LRR-repeat protein At5g44980 [Cajanus cajan]